MRRAGKIRSAIVTLSGPSALGQQVRDGFRSRSGSGGRFGRGDVGGFDDELADGAAPVQAFARTRPVEFVGQIFPTSLKIHKPGAGSKDLPDQPGMPAVERAGKNQPVSST
jgi:hypothetical protein